LALHGGAGWLADHATAREVLGTAQRLVVVPTAAAFEEPEEAVASAVAWFEPLGLTVTASRILTRHDANEPARVAEIAAADALLFTGGQPLHLRSVLTESAAWSTIVAAFANGVPIIAEGAAASAFGDPMLDPRGGAFTIGLGLVTGMAVLPESDTWSSDRRTRTMRLAGNARLALVPSATTLVRSPTGEWSSRGPDTVTFVGAGST
jgi:cyanophycinase